jgi:hypothetical protein
MTGEWFSYARREMDGNANLVQNEGYAGQVTR